MKWITRERPKIDRIACPWLIKNFVDSNAEFMYVPADKVKELAKKLKAIPFDIPDVEFSHHNDKCTFDYILEKYKLEDPALLTMAVIVRGADTDRHDLASQASGLWAISAGLAHNVTDDHELLALVQSGSHPAFAELVQRHTARFYRLAFRYLQNKEAAEDMVQDAFLKLWEDPGKWQADRNTKFTTWFYRVVVNLCLDWQKRKRPLAINEEMPLADERESVDQTMLRDEEQRILEQEIAALPERQRTALNLCFDEGLSNQDAADAMGVNLKALQSLIMRAKTTLKERMKNYL